jgi:hypothetical protein
MQTTKQRLRGARFRSKLLRRPLVRSRHKRLTPRDAFLASYPRSGTTWLRFLLYETLTGESPEFGSIRAAVPSVGKQRGARPVLVGGGRLVQTHETYSHGDRLVLYVVRDPRRVALSEYFWQKRNRTYDGSLAAFVEDFCRGRSNPWGSWGAHVEFWRQSEPAGNSHLMIVRYEDLSRDTFEVFRRVVNFLGANPEDDLVTAAIEHNCLHGMRSKEDAARRQGWRATARADIRFVNAGTGGYCEQLSDDETRLIERTFGSTMASLDYLE